MQARAKNTTTEDRQTISDVTDSMTRNRLYTYIKITINRFTEKTYLDIVPFSKSRWKDLEASEPVVHN